MLLFARKLVSPCMHKSQITILTWAAIKHWMTERPQKERLLPKFVIILYAMITGHKKVPGGTHPLQWLYRVLPDTHQLQLWLLT